MAKAKEYIVYDNRTDDVLASGTAKECTKALGYASKDVFYSQICSQRHRGQKGYPQRNKHIDIYIMSDEGLVFA